MSQTAQRIGIFGGSFNPPHLGHKKLVCYAADKLSLTLLYLIPVALPPHKQAALAPDADRLAMCRLTFAENPRIRVSDMEIRRGGNSYTIDTVTALQQAHPNAQLTLLIGSDLYPDFHLWRDYARLLELCTLCVTMREAEAKPENPFLPLERVQFLDTPPLPMSSTEIRRLCREGVAIDRYVTPETAQYIKERKLYLTD